MHLIESFGKVDINIHQYNGLSLCIITFFPQLKAVEVMLHVSSTPATPPSSLYDQFLQSLQAELKRESCDSGDESRVLTAAGERSTPPPPSPSSVSGSGSLEEELFHHNPLLRQFCLSLKVTSSSVQHRQVKFKLYNVTLYGLDLCIP